MTTGLLAARGSRGRRASGACHAGISQRRRGGEGHGGTG